RQAGVTPRGRREKSPGCNVPEGHFVSGPKRKQQTKRTNMRILVAGATGAIGQRLVPQLVARGHQVTATTRSGGKAELLRSMGAEPVIVDGLDAAQVGEAV